MVAQHVTPLGSKNTKLRSPDDAAATQRALAEYVATRDPALRDLLAQRFDRVVQWLASRFAHRGVQIDDLLQAGRIGLVEALDRYDPERGSQFLTYAISMIVGEIKHHLRDNTWGVRAPRRLQELSSLLSRMEDELTARLGRIPTVAELAEHADLPEEQILSAMEVSSLHQPKSLNVIQTFEDSESSEEWQDLVGRADPRLEAVVEYDPLYHALEEMDDRKNWIIRRRYFDQCTQREVAGELGVSQMHVSRLEREALIELRQCMENKADLVHA